MSSPSHPNTTKKMLPLALVVTVLNEAKSIDILMEAIAQQTQAPQEFILVDGGSTDTTVTQANSWQDKLGLTKLTVILKPGNRSVGRNAGIKASSQEWIAITDAGCTPDENWLENLWDAHQANQEAQLISGLSLGAPRSSFQEAQVPYVLVMPEKINPSTFLPATRNMMMTKAAWQKIGMFDEELSDNEDYAFARHAQDQKISMSMTFDAVVRWHPRPDLKSFSSMIFRFARGDARAGLFRPKVALIFARYLAGLLLILTLWYFQAPQTLPIIVSLLTTYSLWAIVKNYQYTTAWWWLPVLQFVSDGAVMVGNFWGLSKKYSK